MFKRLIEKLYFKYCTPNICEMTRKQLGVFNKVEPVEDKEKQDIFYIEALSLKMNPTLTFIFEELVDDVINDIVYKTDDKLIIYDRFTINGVSLLKERIDYYAGLAPQLEVEFDKYSIT